ncbi:MAG TPA: signal peptidase I [Candidatus Nitrosotenuis sp.]|nr:signal peptidase I [Candidatus Nitrosotenuis sp.]
MNEIQLITMIYILVAGRLLVHLFPAVAGRLRRTLNEYLDSFIVAGSAALLLITFVVRSFYIPSESMVPTLLVHDYILVNKFICRFCQPDRGDILVFKPPPGVADSDDKDFIKRVVGIEDDVLEIKDGVLYRNGEKVDEPYVHEQMFGDMPAYRVPRGHVFMMGDNRNNSDDSRRWGPLPLDRVVGKAFIIFWPPQRIRLLH